MSGNTDDNKTANIMETSFSEEEYGKRIDRCLTDVIVKGSGGFLLGATLSLLLFRRKSWPVVMGTGFGIGVAFKNCEKELNSINSPPPKIIVNELLDEVRQYLMRSKPPSLTEEDFNENINRCFVDFIVKASGGFLVGSLVAICFKRYSPIFAGTSFGLGAAYRNCITEIEHSIRRKKRENS